MSSEGVHFVYMETTGHPKVIQLLRNLAFEIFVTDVTIGRSEDANISEFCSGKYIVTAENFPVNTRTLECKYCVHENTQLLVLELVLRSDPYGYPELKLYPGSVVNIRDMATRIVLKSIVTPIGFGPNNPANCLNEDDSQTETSHLSHSNALPSPSADAIGSGPKRELGNQSEDINLSTPTKTLKLDGSFQATMVGNITPINISIQL